ncbi:hypothetical protein AAZX31_10G146900 [Glycine max]
MHIFEVLNNYCYCVFHYIGIFVSNVYLLTNSPVILPFLIKVIRFDYIESLCKGKLCFIPYIFVPCCQDFYIFYIEEFGLKILELKKQFFSCIITTNSKTSII